MTRHIRKILFVSAPLLLTLFLFPVLALAQEGDTLPAAIDWMQIVALAINTVGVTLAVQLLKKYVPGLPATAKQLLTLLAGPVLMWAGTTLSSAFGFPIDFTSIIEVIGAGLLSSVTASTVFTVGKKQGMAKR